MLYTNTEESCSVCGNVSDDLIVGDERGSFGPHCTECYENKSHCPACNGTGTEHCSCCS